eukprot:CAMPEP_0176202674 /NCGR_PEP_ID=MMETSP0121_2-20121125/10192_1 /TAXON_ID=160619 /ORGANISM="Kryptoperidinium foliaceum, Strain CCMP 1326" /LENGTH=88 /DNA_ID=CAMNT_0017541567 /DNA_START=64 /DNA_END=330 /DNA_ORIENTATION=-
MPRLGSLIAALALMARLAMPVGAENATTTAAATSGTTLAASSDTTSAPEAGSENATGNDTGLADSALGVSGWSGFVPVMLLAAASSSS